MLAEWPSASSRHSVIGFDVIAFSALIVVVMNISVVWPLRMERTNLRHGDPP